MRFDRQRLGRLAGLCACAAVAVVIVGCGSSSKSSSSSSTSATPATKSIASVAALVPASIKSKGTLNVASDASYAPDEYIDTDGHTVIGMDVDLIKAIAGAMGLQSNVTNVTFTEIFPGMAAGKYDLSISSTTDNKEREKTVDFVTYASVGESFYTKAQGGTTIGSIADICGKTVSVEKGTTEKDDAATQSGKCTKAGKKPVTVLVFPDQNGANLAVSSGRAQLGFADTPVALYQVKQTGGKFKLVGQPYATGPYGIAIPKNSALAKPILAAVKALMANGTYKTILAKWGLAGIGISKPVINGAIF
jgi:polar amino acid transport system substrate-binding protein